MEEIKESLVESNATSSDEESSSDRFRAAFKSALHSEHLLSVSEASKTYLSYDK